MSLPELLAALERQAAAEVAAIDAAARAELVAARAEAARRRDDRARAELASRRAAAEVAAAAAIAEAERAARRLVLDARAAMLERLRAAVLARLPAAAPVVVDRLIDRAMTGAGAGRVVLRCPPSLARAVESRGAAPVVADPETRSGVRADVDGGRLVVDATLEALFERVWPRLRIEAAREVSP